MHKTKLFLNIVFSILFVAISFKSVAQQDTLKQNREARELLRQGNKLYNQQKFSDAEISYRKALGKNSAYDKATYNYGNTLYQNKKYKEAYDQFEIAAKTAKDKISKAEAYHNMGNAMVEENQYGVAVEAYKNALRNNPKDDETRYNLAVALKELTDQKKKGNKDKDNKDQKNKKDKKDQKKNKDDDKNKKDKGDKEDENGKKDKEKEKNDESGKDNKGDKGDKNKDQQKPKPQQGKMTPEQMKQLLESLNNEEKKTQKKMNVKKSKGRKVRQEKDW